MIGSRESVQKVWKLNSSISKDSVGIGYNVRCLTASFTQRNRPSWTNKTTNPRHLFLAILFFHPPQKGPPDKQCPSFATAVQISSILHGATCQGRKILLVWQTVIVPRLHRTAWPAHIQDCPQHRKLSFWAFQTSIASKGYEKDPPFHGLRPNQSNIPSLDSLRHRFHRPCIHHPDSFCDPSFHASEVLPLWLLRTRAQRLFGLFVEVQRLGLGSKAGRKEREDSERASCLVTEYFIMSQL